MLGWLATPQAMTPLPEVLGREAATAIAGAFGDTTVGEFLSRLPQRYVAQGHSLGVDYAQVGEGLTAVVEVVRVAKPEIHGNQGVPASEKRRHPLTVTVTDGERTMPMPIFGQAWLANVLHPGTRLLVLCTLGRFRDQLQLSNADVLVIGANGQPGAATGKLKKLIDGADGMAELRGLLARPFLPIHRGRKGLPGILIALYLRRLLRWLPVQAEPLPAFPAFLPGFDEALREAHFPGVDGPQGAINRLKYDEALELQLALALRRAANAGRTAPTCPVVPGGLTERLGRHLPYELTGGQRGVLADISADLGRPTPMNRLLQGEVGSGKTVVALLGMLQVLDSGRQAALLAPTEVLAAQHARTIRGLLADADVDVHVTLLTGSMSIGDKRRALLDIVSGVAGIVIGTHALLGEGVEFFDLGMVVVDEQHRFGVRQRDRLRDRGRDGMTPHVLVMTATPIPRTIAMTVFGDLDVSELAELPGQRREVQSIVVPPPAEKPAWEDRAWERIREEAEAGHRAFIVSPRILGEGETVEDNFDLARMRLPGIDVGFLHGQMSPQDKEAAMADLVSGRTSVLVATTVIEVGVDVPEATIMMIRRAESYGVSQLHQLRGRIGRGGLPGQCFLCTETAPGSPERDRLEAIAATNDGFALADIDVRTRKHGDVLGEGQSGLTAGLGLLDLGEDRRIIERARADAATLAAADPGLARTLTYDITDEEAGFLDRS